MLSQSSWGQQKSPAKGRARSGSLKGVCPRFDSSEAILKLLTKQLKHLSQASEPPARPVDQLAKGSELNPELHICDQWPALRPELLSQQWRHKAS
jgi:hypothetical protein